MTAEEMRREAVRLMQSREKRNTYTNGGKRGYFFGYPDEGGAGWSDCSSAVRACIKRAAGIDIGSNTNAQVKNCGMGVVVERASGNYPDETKLLPGDCLYFKGNPSHIGNVGHVEMYTGNDECYGHGSGKGPTRKKLHAYCKSRASAAKRYFMAIRWIAGESESCALGARTLRDGCAGEDVAKLQDALTALGYDVGASGTDGIFGENTRGAVMRYQADRGMEADGILKAEDAAAFALPGKVLVTGDKAIVRRGAGTHYKAVGVERKGESFSRTGTDDEAWYGILYNDGECWISARCVVPV